MLFRALRLRFLAFSLLPVAAAAQVLDPLVVTATRSPQPLSALPVTVDVFNADDLSDTTALTVDEALKASAAFSLFRRQGSLSANPTTQGVSLRNLGPNGAGRTLVLVDGIPLNDPFGGWVTWSKAPRLALTSAEIVRGGGSSAWGSAALGGTIQLLTASSQPADAAVSSTQLQIEGGDFGTFAADLHHTTVRGADTFTINTRGFRSDGFRRTASEWAGPIDRPTDLEQGTAQVSWSRTTTNGTRGTLTARIFREERGNGTPLQRNRTREALLAASASGTLELLSAPADWTATAYVQTQEFANRFTSVSDARDSEIAVLDQYAVPADAAGAAATITWSDNDQTTTAGADVRWVQGETRENYFRSGDDFTRNRRAGGTQTFAGVFAHHDRALTSALRGSLSARLDAWQLSDAHRIEIDRTAGSIVREDDLPSRDGVEFNPRAGLVWQATNNWRLHTAAYSAFRLPTLNELYRPFRVGNDITEANPDLAPESLRGIELGTTFATRDLRLRANAFTNRLEDAVANVTLGAGPGVVPGVGFVPAGGLGRRRENLPRVDVHGLELSAHWQPATALTLRADYLYSDSSDHATGLNLPQVSRHTVVLGADWRPLAALTFGAQARYLSDAYEDDANTLVLDAAMTVDLRLGYRFAADRELFVAIENVFDEAVVTRRTTDGLYDLGTPRFSRAGVRWTW
ncbi:TonB-dependent receptor [Actomonas aquatica]|uniref:TonB-dependent receptor n=1 Tax=Actomonas aquatica TaxID=2866162 RepID=A0ABZ1C4K2_9BACT|nr:TonB-dependent receptor [Opitutus sp. WL0086]WRQ86287.1 TonB-dependent receptor [Opitutus sp. WL0086]